MPKKPKNQPNAGSNAASIEQATQAGQKSMTAIAHLHSGSVTDAVEVMTDFYQTAFQDYSTQTASLIETGSKITCKPDRDGQQDNLAERGGNGRRSRAGEQDAENLTRGWRGATPGPTAPRQACFR
jgi:hypothetical protein